MLNVHYRDGEISTDILYPILLQSGLARETLGQLWALSNVQTPGKLIPQELYILLAMIAVAQVSSASDFSHYLLSKK